MRLIDADKLRSWVQAEANPYGAPKLDYDSGVKVLDMIRAMPTIEPAEDWKPFKLREMTEEERKEYPPEITGIWCEPLPDHGQDILVSDGKHVWDDTFYNDDYCYLDGGYDIKEGMAWMPMPKAYKPKENDE